MAALADALQSSTRFITRFAPSPTGYLHLGHLAHALYVWGVSKVYNSQVILRIEDHDTQRCRMEYIDAIFDDLHFFGLEWDNRVNGELFDPIQSSRNDIFKNYFRILCREQLVYGCECSRKMIEERSGRVNGELCYDGFCRNETLIDPPLYRAVIEECDVAFRDVLKGIQVQNPKHQCGDFAIFDRHNQWTYNFTVAIDDMIQGVNLIVRGEDILHATSRQILLAKELGRENPAYFMHHPLVTSHDGQKLSKRFLSRSLKERRESGESKEKLIGEAAAAIGLLDKPQNISLDAIPDLVRRYVEQS
ncbi:MAG: glutamate--tRNA ligase family protein [Fibrobacterales bacterium]